MIALRFKLATLWLATLCVLAPAVCPQSTFGWSFDNNQQDESAQEKSEQDKSEPESSKDENSKHESGDGQSASDQPVAASKEGEQAMGGFRKPEGWEVSLFAAEPLVANAVTLAVDNQGRVFVGESFRQDRGVTDNRAHDNEWLMADLASQSVQDRIDYHRRLLGTAADEYTVHDDRIRRLVDTNGDGQADEVTIFAEGFNQLEDGTGAGILVRGNDVYYTCIPHLWLLRDTNGDGQAEERQALHSGYGVRVAFRGHDSHGLVMGPDGHIYFSIGDRGYNIETASGKFKDPESGAVFRCELDGSQLEVFATGLRNPQELAFDDYGYLFTGDNNSDSGDKARWVNVMQGGDSGWRMMYQYIPDRGPFNREKIWHPYSAETPAYIVPPIANIGDGPSGLTSYPGTGMSGDFANCFFMVDFRGGASNSGIRLIRAQPKGAFWEVERSEEFIWNILATDAQFGPDGGLWVCDWVNGWVGEGKGRIYRFFETAAQEELIVREVQQLLATGFAQSDSAKLSEWLRHADRRIRLEAQWELATRGQTAAFIDLIKEPTAGTLPRLHAVWGLGHAARLNPTLRDAASAGLQLALVDDDLDVRATAASVVGDLKLERFAKRLVELISDSEPRVQYAACLAAGALQLDAALEPVSNMLASAADSDPGLRHAAIMAFKGATESKLLLALGDHPARSVRLAAVVALRKRLDPGLANFLSDADAGVQLEAARAIHDTPELHSALPQVASLIKQMLVGDALVHRVLNANFRLGGDEGLAGIAAFAANHLNSDAMRIEAMAMLGGWGVPGKLDRVMNRYQPLEERDPAAARQAFEQHLANLLSGSDEVVRSAIAAAAELKIEGAAAALRGLASDPAKDERLRINALIGVVHLQSTDALSLVEALVVDAVPAVRAQALKLLSELAPEAALPRVTQALDAEDGSERQMAWDALATLELPEADALINQGVERYVSGGLAPDMWLNVLEAAQTRLTPETKQKLEEFEQQLLAADELEGYREATFGGNVAAGKELFFNRTELSCVRCHQVGTVGGEVGPNLTEIGKTKDNRYLLQSIVQPDAKIAENYESVLLLTEDDEVISGVLRKETPSQIELIDANGNLIHVDPAVVVSRRKGQSAMPADLLKSLTRRELRDLVAYLSSLKGEE